MNDGATSRSRLARPKSELLDHYDAVVVGSGYGGGIAALRLSEAGLRVCVLERGAERLPDEFPRGTVDAPANVQTTIDTASRTAHIGDRLALVDVRIHDDVSVVVGCGVGGTSLINANVFVVPDERQLESGWPRAFVDDTEGRARAHRRARTMLAPTTAGPDVAKMALVREVGQQLGQTATRLPLMVERGDTTCDSPVTLAPCTGCGNCSSGCRVGAKRSVEATYLAEAVRRGAHVFTEVSVRWVEHGSDGWRVRYAPVCRPVHRDTPPPWISAQVVVLAAGSLGSTEILLRSKREGLAVPRAAGSSFSANGNTMGAIESPTTPVRGTGVVEGQRGEPGACITMAVELPAQADRPALHIEDGTVPAALAGLARVVGMAERIAAGASGRGVGETTRHVAKEVVATAAEASRDANENALALLVQYDDGAQGRLELGQHGAAVRWPGYGKAVPSVDAALRGATEGMGARYRPLRPYLFGRQRHLTVHPLGGCPMGTDRYDGVVDHTCAVFDPNGEARTSVHRGLYVCDGSVIPRAVGKNPVGTICIVAERAMAMAAETWRREVDARPPTPFAGSATRRSFALSEAFDGWLTTESVRDPASVSGSGDRHAIAGAASAHFAIEMPDFEAFRRDPSHAASVLGTVTSDAIGGTCTVYQGKAFLLTDDPVDHTNAYNLYDLRLLHPSGARYRLSGTKVWQRGGLPTLWAGGTQMVVEISDEADTKVASGLLRMSATQFLGSFRSYEGRVSRRLDHALRTRVEFLAFSAKRLRKRLRWRR